MANRLPGRMEHLRTLALEYHRARALSREEWAKALEWEGIDRDAPFIVFSEDNPHNGSYDALAREAMAALQSYNDAAIAAGIGAGTVGRFRR